jgi:hypothetical protein
MLGTLKTVQADNAFRSGEVVREVCMAYTEPYYSTCMLLSERNLATADCHVPKTDTAGRLWSTERPHIDLQVPETLVRALLMEEMDGGITDLQVPEVLLFMLYAEGY